MGCRLLPLRGAVDLVVKRGCRIIFYKYSDAPFVSHIIHKLSVANNARNNLTEGAV
jgi:uncharacterized metal-binding protein